MTQDNKDQPKNAEDMSPEEAVSMNETASSADTENDGDSAGSPSEHTDANAEDASFPSAPPHEDDDDDAGWDREDPEEQVSLEDLDATSADSKESADSSLDPEDPIGEAALNTESPLEEDTTQPEPGPSAHIATPMETDSKPTAAPGLWAQLSSFGPLSIGILLLVLGSILITMLLTKIGGTPETVLSLAVFVLCLGWGIRHTDRSHRRLTQEEETFKEIGAHAQTYNNRFMMNTPPFTVETVREIDFVPSIGGSKDRETLEAIRSIRSLIAESKKYTFPSSIDTYEMIISDLKEYTNYLKTIQMMAVRIGILFTFVGLVIAISNLDLSQGSASGDLSQQGANSVLENKAMIEGMLQGLATAFGTSIAGLGAALFLQVLSGLLTKKIKSISSVIKNTIEEVSSCLSRAGVGTDLMRSLDSIHDLSRDHIQQLQDHRYSVETTIDKGVEKIIAQTGSLREAVKAVYETGDVFKAAADLHRSQCHLLHEATVHIKSLETSISTVAASQMDQFDKLSDRWRTTSEAGLKQGFDHLQTSIADTLSNLQTATKEMSTGKNALHGLEEILLKERENQHARSDRLEESIDRLSNAVKSYTDEIQQQQGSKSYSLVKDIFKWFRITLFLIIAIGIALAVLVGTGIAFQDSIKSALWALLRGSLF